MSKAKKEPTQGAKKKRAVPYVAMAFFCEKALREPDNVISAIRIVDRYTIPDPASLPKDQTPLVLPLTVVIGLRCDTPLGKKSMTLVRTSPSGKATEAPPSTSIEFTEEGAGTNLQINLMLEVSEAGLHWVDLFVDGEIVTRMPLRLEFLKPAQGVDQSEGAGSAQPSPSEPESA